MKQKFRVFLAVLCTLAITLTPLSVSVSAAESTAAETVLESDELARCDVKIPSYTGKAYTVLNNNEPSFTAKEKTNTQAFETYSPLDALGRCGVAYANICPEIEPTDTRGDISAVHPSGWQSNMGWERCHLIGYQLSGENANKENLITGTHYFNVSGMLPFENMVDDYVDETGNHVLYRVTPHYTGKNLIADGVEMEAWSVEDQGEGICFHVFCHNVQQNRQINYATGTVKVLKPTVSLTGKTATYTGKSIAIGSAKRKDTAGALSYTYYVNSKCTSKTTKQNSGAAKTGGAPVYAGTYYVKATAAKTALTTAATSKAVKLVVKGKTQTISGGTYQKTYKQSTLAKSRQSFRIGAKSSSGNLTYQKQSGSGALSISGNGTVTVAKNTAPGTYTAKVKMTAKGTKAYASTSAVRTITVRVTKTTTPKPATSFGTCYWTPSGSKYHSTSHCPTLSRSRTIYSGANPPSGLQPCKVCH